MEAYYWHKVAAISGIILSLYSFFFFRTSTIHSSNWSGFYVTGMAALGLGTYGAHVFKPENPAYKEVQFIRLFIPVYFLSKFCFRFLLNLTHQLKLFIDDMKVWQTASLYHLVHTAALVGAPITKRPHIVSFSLCS